MKMQNTVAHVCTMLTGATELRRLSGLSEPHGQQANLTPTEALQLPYQTPLFLPATELAALHLARFKSFGGGARYHRELLAAI